MLDTRQHKARLQSYFDGEGYTRWAAIYGDSELSAVRRSIRKGHGAMLEQATAWLAQRIPDVGSGAAALDAGCGTGLFTVPMAAQGLNVTAVDIAPQMVDATRTAADSTGYAQRVTCRVGDLETITDSYSVVACFDVLIHYPHSGFVQLCTHLANICSDTLLITYAPYSPLLSLLHRASMLFPRGEQHTNIQMIRDTLVYETLQQAGLQVQRTAQIRQRFYYVTLLEARRIETT